ncbi:MAG TPA: pyridoxamine 5'-phosphate oxidase family protein [Gaiellales bacterium]|nr:pyridoxamine 5'-phosphate oxidase family protein [Gaiellales bacterium]
MRQLIERSPFACVATCRPDGGLDVSPRGDPAGFVRILDDRRLLIPERPGNRLADTLTNLLADPRIALLFLIPGVGDTFRVNGELGCDLPRGRRSRPRRRDVRSRAERTLCPRRGPLLSGRPR